MDGLSLTSTRWIIFSTVGIGAYLLAVIVSTGISHTSEYQTAPLSGCWMKDCLSAFGVLITAEVHFVDLQGLWDHITHKCSTNKLTHSLSWWGDMPVSGQQKFAVTENQLWWWVCECDVGVAHSLAKQEWSFHGMEHPLLTLLRMAG